MALMHHTESYCTSKTKAIVGPVGHSALYYVAGKPI